MPRLSSARLAERYGLTDAFPDAVLAETARWQADPGIDDPSLVDRGALPFVTIDNPGSRDLDQAMAIERAAGGYRLWYALADAAWFVRPGSALFAEALRRGASFYLPGWSIPMLPRPLSEGLVSLGPGVERRAMLWSFALDASGEPVDVRLERARVRSRAQLTYADVQSFYDAPAAHALAGQPWTETLELLAEVGKKRLAAGAAKGVVPARRQGLDVEAYNERVSVMTNVAAAVHLGQEGPHINEAQAIYRAHPAPDPRRLDELAREIDRTVELRRLDPAIWRWRRADGEALVDYLARLPRDEGQRGLVASLERQALLVNQRSVFTDVPSAHHGLGAASYARVTAPMREIVGIFTHKELWELEAAPTDPATDEVLRAQVIASGNAAKTIQASLDKDVARAEIDELLERLEGTLRGVVLGTSADKYYVELRRPRVEVKVYRRDVHQGAEPLALGDRVEIAVIGRDERRDRWRLDVRRI